jgi:hypothetical protein
MRNKMNKKYFCILAASLVFITSPFFAQNDSLEVFIIDAFVTPEKPHNLNLSFFTSEEAITKIEIDSKYLINISDTFATDHNATIDFMNYKFTNKYIPYKIFSELTNGKIHQSESFELVLPYEEYIETKEGADPISTILFGVFLYLFPSPNIILIEDENYFSLTKELPIITFYSSGYNYPSGNISLEYTHIYDSSIKNYLRLGYKHFFPIDFLKYISPGITAFTNFNGFNGASAEVSIGLFNIYDVFTVYSRYRYNSSLENTEQNFHEISIGLYSHFFTIDL